MKCYILKKFKVRSQSYIQHKVSQRNGGVLKEIDIFAQKIKLSRPSIISLVNDQIHSFLQIWSHLLKKFSVENVFMQCMFVEV